MRLLFEMFVGITLSVYTWRVNKWVALFLLLSILSMVFPFYTVNSYRTFTAILCGVLLYVVIVQVFTVNTIHYLYNAICIIALINVGYLFIQYFNLDPLFVGKDKVSHNVLVALMGNRNFASAIFVFCLPAFLRWEWTKQREWEFKKLRIKIPSFAYGWFMFIPFLVLGLILSKTMGGAVSAFLGLIVFSFSVKCKFRYKALCATILLCALSYYYYYQNNCQRIDLSKFFSKSFLKEDERIKAWGYALSLYKQHWIFGSGIGHWKEIGRVQVPQLGKTWWIFVHNEYLQCLFEMGITVVFIFIGYFINIFRRITDKLVIPLMALTIIASNCFINFPFHIGTTAIVSIIWLAVLEIKLK